MMEASTRSQARNVSARLTVSSVLLPKNELAALTVSPGFAICQVSTSKTTTRREMGQNHSTLLSMVAGHSGNLVRKCHVAVQSSVFRSW